MEKENEKSEEKEIESKQEEIIENKEEEKKQETEISQEVEENIKEEKKENDENNEEEVNEAKEEIEEDAHVEKKKTKKLFIILPVLIIVLLFLSTIFAITNINNEKVIDGVYIEQVAIYGMSKEEINNLVGEKLSTISEVSITYGDYNDVVKIEVSWMEQYAQKYPYMAEGNREIHSYEDSEYSTSFETYLRGELHTYSHNTLTLYADMVKKLEKEGKSMSLMIMDAMVKSYGYKDIDDAERQQKIRAVNNINL